MSRGSFGERVGQAPVMRRVFASWGTDGVVHRPGETEATGLDPRVRQIEALLPTDLRLADALVQAQSLVSTTPTQGA